jgi:hypothetical protein
VAREQRGRCTLYKLRFRVAGRQRVRYLGTDAAAAAAIARELAGLHVQRWLARRGRCLRRQARRLLRQARHRLGPLLLARGYRFHGLTIRRCQVPVGDAALTHGVFSCTKEDHPMTNDDVKDLANSNLAPEPPRPRGARSKVRPMSAYRRRALTEPNPLLGSLGVLTSDLMAIAHSHAVAIRRALATGPGDLESLAAVQPALHFALQLNRQIDRFVQLELRLTGSPTAPVPAITADIPEIRTLAEPAG